MCVCTWSIWETIKAIGKCVTSKGDENERKTHKNVICRRSLSRKLSLSFSHEVQTRIIESGCDGECFFQSLSFFIFLILHVCGRNHFFHLRTIDNHKYIHTLLMKCAFKLTFWLLIDFSFIVDALPAGMMFLKSFYRFTLFSTCYILLFSFSFHNLCQFEI